MKPNLSLLGGDPLVPGKHRKTPKTSSNKLPGNSWGDHLFMDRIWTRRRFRRKDEYDAQTTPFADYVVDAAVYRRCQSKPKCFSSINQRVLNTKKVEPATNNHHEAVFEPLSLSGCWSYCSGRPAINNTKTVDGGLSSEDNRVDCINYRWTSPRCRF